MRNIYIIHRKIYHEDGQQVGFGGIENYILSLAQVFKAQGWKTILVQPAKSNFTFTKDDMKIHGITTGLQRGNRKKHALSRWAQQHADQKSDVIIFATDSYATKCPNHHSIAIQHGVSWDKPAKNQTKIKLFISSLVSNIKYLSYIKSDNKLICVDHNFVNWYRTWFNMTSANMQVIYNFYQQKVTDTQFDEKWDTSNVAIKVIIARRFVDYRGIKLVAPVLKKLLDKYANLEVTFAGDGPLKPYLDELFNDDDRVRIGRYTTDECFEWHQQHHIAIVPTLGSEGTSLAMIEAMAAGCAIISTNVGGLSNLVIDQFNGYLVMPESAPLYNALDHAIENKQRTKSIALSGLRSIEMPCSFEHWAEQWVGVINRMK